MVIFLFYVWFEVNTLPDHSVYMILAHTVYTHILLLAAVVVQAICQGWAMGGHPRCRPRLLVNPSGHRMTRTWSLPSDMSGPSISVTGD